MLFMRRPFECVRYSSIFRPMLCPAFSLGPLLGPPSSMPRAAPPRDSIRPMPAATQGRAAHERPYGSGAPGRAGAERVTACGAAPRAYRLRPAALRATYSGGGRRRPPSALPLGQGQCGGRAGPKPPALRVCHARTRCEGAPPWRPGQQSW